MAMENKQAKEWKIAQDINVSLDLISAAKDHLKFLAAVDSNNWIFNNARALRRAVYRYHTCWIPLLARHTESLLFEGPLVVPLDCEWIWHCHRLNPIAYKSDCEAMYNKILDNKNVVSITNGVSKKETEDVWNNLYPNESFVLDQNVVENDNNDELTEASKFTSYDLISASQRQSSFYYQVSEPHMSNAVYLEKAVARYKGFLHLIKRKMEMNVDIFLAPTYDIDLIWHTHQSHPILYCNDLENILGMVLGHDDTVTDRTKGQKLDVGFTNSTNTWAHMYGFRYRRAGAMHKFSSPTSTFEKFSINSNEENKTTHLEDMKIIKVMLEFVDLKDMPEEHQMSQIFVSFSKTQQDFIFIGRRTLPILSKSEEEVACFECEPTGEFIFELMAHSPSNKETITLGSCYIYLEDILLPESGFMFEKWMELKSSTNNNSNKPISLRVAMSVTPPTHALLSQYLPSLPSDLCVKSSTGKCGPTAGKCGPTAGKCGPTAGKCGPTSGKCGPTAGKCGPTAGKCGPTAGKCGPTAGKCGPTAGKCGPTSGKCGPTSGKCGPTAGKCGPTDGKCGPTAGKCGPTSGKCGPTAGKCDPTAGKCGPTSGKCGPMAAWCIPTAGKCGPTSGKCGPTSGKCGPTTETKANPCGIPIGTKTILSPCGIPFETKASPCGVPFETKLIGNIIGANVTNGTTDHACFVGRNGSGCMVHGTNSCSCGIPCA